MSQSKLNYFTGVKLIAFYNISSTAGISGYYNFNVGRTTNNKNDFIADAYKLQI
jgi:hypothetical protein